MKSICFCFNDDMTLNHFELKQGIKELKQGGFFRDETTNLHVVIKRNLGATAIKVGPRKNMTMLMPFLLDEFGGSNLRIYINTMIENLNLFYPRVFDKNFRSNSQEVFFGSRNIGGESVGLMVDRQGNLLNEFEKAKFKKLKSPGMPETKPKDFSDIVSRGESSSTEKLPLVSRVSKPQRVKKTLEFESQPDVLSWAEVELELQLAEKRQLELELMDPEEFKKLSFGTKEAPIKSDTHEESLELMSKRPLIRYPESPMEELKRVLEKEDEEKLEIYRLIREETKEKNKDLPDSADMRLPEKYIQMSIKQQGGGSIDRPIIADVRGVDLTNVKNYILSKLELPELAIPRLSSQISAQQISNLFGLQNPKMRIS